MKYGFRGLGILILGLMLISASDAARARSPKPVEEKLGWRFSIQAWSFNHGTFYEAIDKAAALGVHYIEAFPGQKLSPEHPEVMFNQYLSPEQQAEVLAKLRQAHVKLVNFGVIGLDDNAAENRRIFDFAKKMGIETIVSEPLQKNLDALDKLCQEYQINIAIHNHPKVSKSPYWNPEVLAKALQGHSKRIGACADIGHWMRSGVMPVDGFKILAGRIISLHLKDVNAQGGDVPLGSGVENAMAMLQELHRQGFQGVFSAEYELGEQWANTEPEIAQSIKYFRQTAARILAEKAPVSN